MANIKRANTSGITKSGSAISDVPDAPTIGTATDLVADGQVSVAFTAAATGGTPTSYTATSTPGSITGTGASSPITVTGLTNGTSYTFTVTATNSTGSAVSSASNSVSPTTWATGLYESIATGTGNGTSATIVFSSIPSTFTHLQIRGIGRNTSNNNTFDRMRITFNSDSGTNYSLHELYTVNGTAYATATANASAMYGFNISYGGSSYANVFGAGVIDILDYANTGKYKTLRSLGGVDVNSTSLDEGSNFASGSWRSTSAISTITLNSAAGFWATGTHFALYGIKG